MTIHHMVHKAAARLNVSIHEVGNGFQLVDLKLNLPSTEIFSDTASALEAMRSNQVVFKAPEPTVLTGKCGVMSSSYHARYSANPGGPGCNDELDLTIREVFHRPVVKPGKEGQPTNKAELDEEALEAWGQTIGLWNPAWSSLNPGMRRMNLVNRVRGYLRNNPSATIAIGDKQGRFGIAPSEKALKKASKLAA